MMFKLGRSLFISISLMLIGGQALAKEELDLDGFTDIAITTPYDLYIKQGKAFKVVVDANGSSTKHLETYVKKNTLYLDMKRHAKNSYTNNKIEYHITLPNLSSVKLIGSGDVFIDEIASKKLQLSLQGSGDIALDGFTGIDLVTKIHGSGDISLKDIKTINNKSSIHGSGDISASGTVEDIEISIHGSGGFNGDKLVVKTADVAVFGSGDVTIKEADTAKTKVHGSGDINIPS